VFDPPASTKFDESLGISDAVEKSSDYEMKGVAPTFFFYFSPFLDPVW
jgi:hypothetical protein